MAHVGRPNNKFNKILEPIVWNKANFDNNNEILTLLDYKVIMQKLYKSYIKLPVPVLTTLHESRARGAIKLLNKSS